MLVGQGPLCFHWYPAGSREEVSHPSVLGVCLRLWDRSRIEYPIQAAVVLGSLTFMRSLLQVLCPVQSSTCWDVCMGWTEEMGQRVFSLLHSTHSTPENAASLFSYISAVGILRISNTRLPWREESAVGFFYSFMFSFCSGEEKYLLFSIIK